MERELYQLVAITPNKMEYVIELNNENKKDKGTLAYIDSGTSRFVCVEQLIVHLFKQGKIPTVDVTFAIKYNRDGEKYLPIILNDKRLAYISKNINNKPYYEDYVFCLLKQVEVELEKGDFYYYLMDTNIANRKKYKCGNYLNNKLIEDIIIYYEAFVRLAEKARKVDIEFGIQKELFNYKHIPFYLASAFHCQIKM